MIAPARSWQYMVEVLCSPGAVLAQVPVASEHRSAIEGDPAVVGDLDVSAQPHDRRHRDTEALRGPCVVAGMDEFCLPIDQQDYRTARRYHR